MKFYDTVTKHRFTTEDRVDAEQVSADLAQMINWMAEAEQDVLTSQEFYNLALKTLKGDRPTGSLHSWGRKRLSRYDFSFQVMSTHPKETKLKRSYPTTGNLILMLHSRLAVWSVLT